MVWFFKKKKNASREFFQDEADDDQMEQKVGKKIDRLIMGVIIGGAIGSVVGLTLAPKKGQDTRKLLKEKGAQAFEFIREVREEIRKNVEKKPKKKSFLGEFLKLNKKK